MGKNKTCSVCKKPIEDNNFIDWYDRLFCNQTCMGEFVPSPQPSMNWDDKRVTRSGGGVSSN